MWPFTKQTPFLPVRSRTPFLDFLYVDTNRIARLVAQTDDRGIRAQFREQAEARSKLAMDFGGVLGGIKSDIEGKLGTDTTFDPSWVLPIAYLRSFEKLLLDDPLNWENGRLVRFTGSIAFRDFPFLLRMMKIPEIADTVRDSDFQTKTLALAPEHGEKSPLWDLLIATLTSDTVSTWSTLNVACTTASTGDLTLKFGAEIGGVWTITGFLDATPDADNIGTPQENSFGRFGDQVRFRLGRPSSYFGITPLTIHRTLAPVDG